MSVGTELGGFVLVVRVLTVLFALGMVIISFEALKRRKRQIFMLVAVAFLAYMARASIRLTENLYPGVMQPEMLTIMTDVLDLFTLLLLFFGIVRE